MYTEMSRSWFSASSRISWEHTRLAVFWSMAEPMKTMRSFNRRWKMSEPGPTSAPDFISAAPEGVEGRADGDAMKGESMSGEPSGSGILRDAQGHPAGPASPSSVWRQPRPARP